MGHGGEAFAEVAVSAQWVCAETPQQLALAAQITGFAQGTKNRWTWVEPTTFLEAPTEAVSMCWWHSGSLGATWCGDFETEQRVAAGGGSTP
jgi:hypothetical protein